MKNLIFKSSFKLILIIFIMSSAFQINAQQECDSLIKVITLGPPFPPAVYEPPIITEPPPTDPDNNGSESQRIVFLLHGLEGDVSSWSNVSPWIEWGAGDTTFNGWDVWSHRMSYEEDQSSLVAAADLIYSGIKIATKDDDEETYDYNFIIAHSLGGLVSRKMDMHVDLSGNAKRYGGIVTYGTPHLGSPAAPKRQDGTLTKVLSEACVNLARGPYLELTRAGSLSTVATALEFVSSFSVDDLLDEMCKEGAIIAGNLANHYFSPVVDELIPGNPVLEELNTYSDPDIVKLAFYGVEDDDIGQKFWATSYSYRNPVGGTEDKLFKAGDNNDEHAKMEKDTAQNRYTAKHTSWKTITDNYGKFELCGPFTFLYRRVPIDKYGDGSNWSHKCITRKNVRKIRDGYHDGMSYVFKVNEIWKHIIGVYDNHESSGVYKCWVTEYDYDEDFYHFYSFETDNPDECYDLSYDPFIDVYLEEIINVTEEESDGIVLRSSAEAFPGVNYPPIEMKGSNHFQMRNDANTKLTLETLFDGGYLKFFETDKN